MIGWIQRCVIALAVLALHGCGGGVNFSGTGSVKSASLGRLYVTNHANYRMSKQDEDERFDRLVAIKPPFDLNAKVGSLSSSDEVSDLKYDTRDLGPDALATSVTFVLGKRYDVKMEFVSPRISMFVLNLVKRPYLITVSATREGKPFYAVDGFPLPADFLVSLLDQQKATAFLDKKWDYQIALLAQQVRLEEEERKRKEAAEQARIAEQKRLEEARAAAQLALEKAEQERQVAREEARRREEVALAEREAKTQAMREETERRRQEREAQGQANRLAYQKANDERQARLAANQQLFEERQLANQRARDADRARVTTTRDEMVVARQRAEARADVYMAANWRPNPMLRQDQNDVSFRLERGKVLIRFAEEERQMAAAANRLR
jgi:hypothetical protein